MSRTLYPAKVEPVFVPAQAPDPSAQDCWRQPLAEPTRRIATALVVTSSLFACPFAPPPAEASTVDKYHAPFAEPRRDKGTAAARQAVPVVLVQASPFTETVSLDRWRQPLSEPVRVAPRLGTAAQQFFAFVKAAPFVEATDVANWHQPLGEPVVKVRAGLRAGQHQSLVFAQPEDVGVSRWLLPLAEPQHRRPLLAPPQQALAFTPAAPFAESVTADRWAQPTQRPSSARRVPQPDAGAWPPYVEAAGETITADKWYAGLATPERQRPGLSVPQHQAAIFTSAAPFAETVSLDRWAQPLAVPVRLPSRLFPGAQPWLAFVKADPFAEATDVAKWHQPLGEPVVKARAGLRAGQQQGFVFAQPEDVTVSRWLLPLQEPVRARPALAAAIQQASAFVQAAPFAETVSVDRWLLALQEPRRERVGLAARHQQAVAFWPYPLPNVDAPVGFYPTYPDRAPGRILAAAQQQSVAFVKAAPFAETVTADRWAQPLAQPTRRIVSVAGIPAIFAGPALPFVAAPDRWWQAFAQPLPRRGAQSTAPVFVAVVAAAGETVTTDKWYAPWQPPARVQQRAAGIVAASPFVEVGTATWWQPVVQPRRVLVGGYQATIAGAPLPIVASPDRWLVAFGKPTRRILRQTAGAAFSPWFSQTGDASDIAWFVPLSGPTLPVWSVAWRQAFIAPLFFVTGLATPRTGGGAITIGGGSSGLSSGRGADGLASARGADGLSSGRGADGLASARGADGLATPRS